MGDRQVGAESELDGAAGAYGTARELMEQAETDARRLRAEAEGFARLREREAEMLVAKARRLLVAAEEKAAVIIATARARALDGTIDLTALDADDELGRVIAPGAARLNQAGHPTRLDRMLATAIRHAVDDAFPVDVSA